MELNSKQTKIWFCADLHFGHRRIIDFCPNTRPYICTEQMNLDIVETWNSQVWENDIVFILGDVSFAKKNVTEYLLSLLKGRKIIVAGNHDNGLKLPEYDTTEIHPYLEIKVDGIDVIMFHYPIYEWNKMHYGSYHLFGHVHGKAVPIVGRLMDVGWDTKGSLWSWEEVHEKLKDMPVRKHGDSQY